MKAFYLTADNALIFWELCHELNLKTEAERLQLMEHMSKIGLVENIVESPKTKEEYVKHLSKNFKVLNIKEK
jgi:hypothetical protein